MTIPTLFNRMGINKGGDDSHVNYLCFTAVQSNSSVKLKSVYGSAPAVNLEYSKNRKDWHKYTLGEVINLNNIDDKVYLRGNNSTFASVSDQNVFEMTGKIKASGSIMTLLKKDGNLTSLNDYAFFKLFKNCTSLIEAPELPATSMGYYCYNEMFRECTSLSSAPELPATTLSASCYSNMFNGCTSLSSAPELPATTLTYNCYGGMFNGCTSLTDMPELPATDLANYCYNWMFNSCTSLTGTVDLPAEIAAPYCYQRMFQGCNHMVTPPTMHLTTVAQGCCDVMFWNCSALTEAPDLPATTLAQGCYGGMFNSCSSLSSMSVGFTSWTDVNGTGNWVYGVNGNGTFHCPSGLAEEHGNNRIPTNFTVAAS